MADDLTAEAFAARLDTHRSDGVDAALRRRRGPPRIDEALS